MSTIQNNVGIKQILIYIPDGVMTDIIPSSHRPCVEIHKMAASHEPIMQSIFDKCCFSGTASVKYIRPVPTHSC